MPSIPVPTYITAPYNGATPYAAGTSYPYMSVPAVGSSWPTWGQTGTEVLAQQISNAQNSKINEKQEMKPADDDPFRFYWCRELDNTWTQRNRLTLDSGDIGDIRWYCNDGMFYAVRLPS